MSVLKIIVTVIFFLVAIALIVIILAQEGKQAGLTGSITGASETYWGKNKTRSMEGAIARATKYGVAAFLVMALLLNMLS